MDKNNTISISVKKGEKNGREWSALLVEIGGWSTLVFPKSRFEMEYIEKVIDKSSEK